MREHPRLPCVKGAGSRVPRKRETEGLSNLHSQGVPGKRKVLIPSVMALRETAMTAPLGQQGEPLGNGLPHQRARWFAMTLYFQAFFNRPTGSMPKHSDFLPAMRPGGS